MQILHIMSLLYTLLKFTNTNSHNTINPEPDWTKLFYNLDSAVWIIFLIGERDKGVKREESAVVLSMLCCNVSCCRQGERQCWHDSTTATTMSWL